MTRMRDASSTVVRTARRTWISRDGRVGLGFRRLAIVDLTSAAMQPMSNEDATLQLVFNGEIYNHASCGASSSPATASVPTTPTAR